MGALVAVTQTADARAERFTVSEDRYRIVAYAALVTLTLIIWTGAAVRLTGSGLGCSHWPNCEAGRVLPALQGHALIEFGNRMVTGVVGLPCLLAAIGAFRLRPFRRDLVVPAVILPLGVLAQAVLGGLTVLFDLSWEMVIAHYLLSAALLVAAAVLVWRLRRGERAAREENPRAVVFATRALTAFGGYVVIAGTFATAAGPHAGGAGTGDYVARLDGLGAHTLRTLIHLHGHSATVMGIAAVGLWFAARRAGAGRLLMRALTAVCIGMAIQGVVGLIQYHSALPSGLVWVHASLAAVLWIALVFAFLAAGRPVRRVS
ncbi:MAG: heme a synthase [Solirubrobacteraceae bacterium]|jgi:cytochrome c oxidase assembly protein subunit 15|nr:heme a synthase [Solirubrobacteraceae bacterium]